MEQLRENFGTRKDLVMYRLETSKNDLKSARILLAAEEIRHASDYDDFYIASREESERQVAIADEFVQLVERYCMVRLEKDS